MHTNVASSVFLHKSIERQTPGSRKPSLPSASRKLRYRRSKVDGIWHSYNGQCSYIICLQKSTSLGLIGSVVEQKVHCTDCTGFFPHIFHPYLSLLSSSIKHSTSTPSFPTANTCQKPGIFSHLICPSLCSMEIRPPNGSPIRRENEEEEAAHAGRGGRGRNL